MSRCTFALSAVSVCWTASGQSDLTGTGFPRILQIQQEFERPGRSAAHQRLEAKWREVYARAEAPPLSVAARSVTGAPEFWRLSGFAFWSEFGRSLDLEATLQAELDGIAEQCGDLLIDKRVLTAVLREDLSYVPSFEIASARFVNVTILRVRPGRASEAPATSYYWFTPFRAFQQIDADSDNYRAHTEALGLDGPKRLRELLAEAIETSETLTFTIVPTASHPPLNPKP